MEPIRFFDCSASFGRRRLINKGSFYSLEDLLRKMEYYGVGEAMVYHSEAAEYDPKEGNRMTMEQIATHPNLKPVWIVMPHYTEEFPPPAELREQLRQNGVRAVRMVPGPSSANYSLADWCSGPLLSMLEECKVPLMLAASQLNWNYQILYDVLAAHPKLRLIFTDIPYHAGRGLYPLLEQFSELYIETIGFKVFGGIEDVCRRFGAGRFIFGSSAPLYSGGSAAGMIRYARISDREKRAIASGNLERLLGEVSL